LNRVNSTEGYKVELSYCGGYGLIIKEPLNVIN